MTEVKAAIRTVELFELFARTGRPLRLLEMAEQLELPQSSCFGLVRTLHGRGYLYELAPRGGYYPSRRMLDQMQAIAAADPLVTRVMRHLESARDDSGETVVLAKMQGAGVVYLALAESPQTIRYSSSVGTRKPLHSTSVGKALLSRLPPSARRRIIGEAKLEGFTERTITDPEALEKEIERSAARGWFSSGGESIDDVGAVAVPVRLMGDWYAIAIAGPVDRIRRHLQGHVDRLDALRAELATLDTGIGTPVADLGLSLPREEGT